jgi:hypothetical protein
VKEKIIFGLAVGITSFLVLLVYSQDSNNSIEQDARTTTSKMTHSDLPVKQGVVEKSGVEVMTQPVSNEKSLLCVDSVRGCFCSDAYGNKVEMPRNQCVKTVYSVSGHPHEADAATLERLQQQKQLVQEIEAGRQGQQVVSKLNISIYVVPPSRCPQNAREIRRQNSNIIECVMQ